MQLLGWDPGMVRGAKQAALHQVRGGVLTARVTVPVVTDVRSPEAVQMHRYRRVAWLARRPLST